MRSAVVKHGNFSAVQEHCPTEKNHSPIAIRQSPFAVHYSLFAIRYSLSFWLGRSLALP
ncbi:hypothetical protein [Fervidibacter sp.]